MDRIKSYDEDLGYQFDIQFDTDINIYEEKELEHFLDIAVDIYLGFERHIYCSLDKDLSKIHKIRNQYLKKLRDNFESIYM